MHIYGPVLMSFNLTAALVLDTSVDAVKKPINQTHLLQAACSVQ